MSNLMANDLANHTYIVKLNKAQNTKAWELLGGWTYWEYWEGVHPDSMEAEAPALGPLPDLVLRTSALGLGAQAL